jgi:hypothetical protein
MFNHDPVATEGAACARAGRAALAGLILPPALAAGCSLAGWPLRAGLDVLTWATALAGFATSGWLCARAISQSGVRALVTAGGFALGGGLVTLASNGLQGLSGREPAWAVVAATLGGFAGGFALAAAVAAIPPQRIARPPRRAAWRGAGAGALGALLALVPWFAARLAPTAAWGGYLALPLAIIGAFGSIVVPFRLLGLALATAERDRRA